MESKVMETLDRLALSSTGANAPTLEARKALLAAAVEDKTAHDRRIAELEAELAKRKELPEDVAEIVNTLRRSHLVHWQAVRLVEFIDATFPKPVPQWEHYAQWVESLESTMSPIGYAYAKKVARFIRESGAKGE